MASDLIASSRYRAVVGLGASGLSVARHLHARGEAFVVVDTRPAPPGLDTLRAEMPEVPVYAGDPPAAVLAAAAELVVSPGLAPDLPFLRAATEAGAELCGDIDLFVAEARAPVIGITGTNAKSTVTALVGAMARAAGRRTGVGGNLGPPALDLLDDESDLYVLELSSFQLERSRSLDLAVACVLNVAPDHLDRHGSLPRYHQAKHRIFRGCRHAVVHGDDPLTIPPLRPDLPVTSWRLREPELRGFGLRREDATEYLAHGFDCLLPATELALPGRHNIGNALAALALGHAAGLPRDAMIDALRHFRGLPHRCEVVVEAAGVRWINDSKATNVSAAAAALAGLAGEGRLFLIAGGRGKGDDFAGLAAPVADHCAAVFAIGETRGALASMLAGSAPVTRCEGLAEAVAAAAAEARAGDTVLLSPACASFDQYASYEARGDAFAELARETARGQAVSRATLYADADPLLTGLGAALVLVGLVAIASASIGYAEAQFADPWHHAQRHALYIAAALGAALVVYQLPTAFWYDSAWLWLLLSLALLALVLVPGIGRAVNGSQRWLPLGPFTLQPSELVKGTSVLFLAGYLVRQQGAVRRTWQGFLRPMLVLGVIAVLLLFEPDFGATVIVMGTAFGMLFLAGMKLLHFFLVIALSLIGLAALALSSPYRLARLTAYTDPWADPYDSGFQLIQSLIAFGRGEWLGVGLGNSVQKLFYLPEAHTDFVFSIWAEETGFVGAVALIGLVFALILRVGAVGRAAARAGDGFAAYVCFGIALIFAGQAFINMGASSGLLPTKGLTLPFVSYGGTALVTSCCLLAIVLRIERDLRAGSGR